MCSPSAYFSTRGPFHPCLANPFPKSTPSASLGNGRQTDCSPKGGNLFLVDVHQSNRVLSTSVDPVQEQACRILRRSPLIGGFVLSVWEAVSKKDDPSSFREVRLLVITDGRVSETRRPETRSSFNGVKNFPRRIKIPWFNRKLFTPLLHREPPNVIEIRPRDARQGERSFSLARKAAGTHD